MYRAKSIATALLGMTIIIWSGAPAALPGDKDQAVEIEADSVDIDESKILAEGQPVRFRQLESEQKGYVTGAARRAEYQLTSEELVLIGDAVLTQGKDSFKSDRIVYDRVRAKRTAGAAAQGKQRVKITIGNSKTAQ